MLVSPFYTDSQSAQGATIRFTRQQASAFAKEVADDFNPLHDIDAKRFCVPGDLLFAVMLSKYGVNRHMEFTFSGMVTDEVSLLLPDEAAQMQIAGTNGKEYLRIAHNGENSTNPALIDKLIQCYVTFSGHTFPHLLVPLLQEQQVMINPDRPMVMYESMLIDLARLDASDLSLELDRDNTRLQVSGKRGNVCLAFNLRDNGELIGRGEKHMLVSGLLPFVQERVDYIGGQYNLWKQQYQYPGPHSTPTAIESCA